jgi:transposase
MLIKTLLNKVEKHKGFVYADVRLVEGGKDRLIVDVRPHKRSKPMCSGCDRRGPCYDTLKRIRYFQFIPLWGILVMFAYRMRRVNCRHCGIKVEKVPWADGKSPVTTSYAWFLSQWAKLMNWKQVASAFGTTWDTVYRAVGLAVAWGLEHRDLKGIRSIGVDEVHWHRGQKFLTIVYQIDEHCKRLLWIGKERTTETLNAFFGEFGLRARWLEYVCSDMWKPYLQVLAKRAKRATHVLDRYHIVAKMNKAIDEVRADEAKRMKADGFDPLLKHSRWCLLKRPENLTDKQNNKLADLLRYNLSTVRAYLLKEELTLLWEQPTPEAAETFLNDWTFRAMRSRLEPVKKIARMLRRHQPLILNWFRAQGMLSSGAVEGMNNKLKVITRSSYGFRTFKATQIALYHKLGKLPEPELAHKFF